MAVPTAWIPRVTSGCTLWFNGNLRTTSYFHNMIGIARLFVIE